MKFVGKNQEALIFKLPSPEHELLKAMLSLYPIRPASDGLPHLPSDTPHSPDPETLTTALADLKAHNSSRIQSFLARSEPSPDASPNEMRRLRVRLDEVDWLLQVLNEIKVGCWYQQGCPEEQLDFEKIADPDSALLALMQKAAGEVQAHVLEALDSPAQT